MMSLALLVAKETTFFDEATAHWQVLGHDKSSPVPLEALRAVEGLDQSHKVSQHI